MTPIPKPGKKKAQPVKVYRDGRVVYNLKTAEGLREYLWAKWDMAKAQNWLCGLCGEPMTRNDVTFDHGIGRGMGGSRRDDRPFVNGNCAVHGSCNREKGSRRAG